jgi:hypothetical protein
MRRLRSDYIALPCVASNGLIPKRNLLHIVLRYVFTTRFFLSYLDEGTHFDPIGSFVHLPSKRMMQLSGSTLNSFGCG